MREEELEDIEIDLFLHAVRERFGYDFSNYAKASLKRRVVTLAHRRGASSISELLDWVLRGDRAMERILATLSVPVTEMFRDPETFLFLRKNVIPTLSTFPRLNIWQAGSATGEEAYSVAIMLQEEGRSERSQIYSTDINEVALGIADEGIYPEEKLAEYARNYAAGGGKKVMRDYCTVLYGRAKLDESLRRMVYFSQHNLVADGCFNTFQMILCRNVLIYFNSELQTRVLDLFRRSLQPGGFLVLGNRESIHDPDLQDCYEQMDSDHQVFRLTEAVSV